MQLIQHWKWRLRIQDPRNLKKILTAAQNAISRTNVIFGCVQLTQMAAGLSWRMEKESNTFHLVIGGEECVKQVNHISQLKGNI